MVFAYEGDLLEFPEHRPLPEELLGDEKAFVRLPGFLVKTHADRIRSCVKEGRCLVIVHFDHQNLACQSYPLTKPRRAARV